MTDRSLKNRTGWAVWAVASSLLVLLWCFSGITARWIVAQSLGLGLSAALIALPAGLLLWRAGTAAGPGQWWKSPVVLATVAAAAVPAWVHVCAWDAVFGKLGWLTAMVSGRMAVLVPSWFAAVWIHGMIAAPQIAVLLHWFQLSSDSELERQASLVLPPPRVFFQVTVPRLAPALFAGFAWTVVSANREMAVADIYQIGTLAEQIYLGYSMGLGDTGSGMLPEELKRSDWPLYAVTLFWWLGTAAVAVAGLQRNFSLGPARQNPGRLPRGGMDWIGLPLAGLLFFVPFANLVLNCGIRLAYLEGHPVHRWSLGSAADAMVAALSDSWPEWCWSFLVGISGATLLLAVAVPVVSASQNSRTCLWAATCTALLLAAVPGPLIGRALVWCSGASDAGAWVRLWDRSIFGPVLASSLFLWPLAFAAVWAILNALPRVLHEQAAVDGFGPWSRFWRVTVGANRQALAGLWWLLLVLCFGELSASHLVRPSGIDILPRLALGKMHSGVDEQTAAIGLAVGAASVLGAGLGYLLIGRSGTRRVGVHSGPDPDRAGRGPAHT